MSKGKQGPPLPRRIEETMLIVFFLTALVLPVLGMLLHIDLSPAHRENRTLAPFPRLALNRHAVGLFPEKFRAYFEDRFGFRQTLIGWQARFKVNVLGVSSSRQVILGKEGWLFQPPYDSSLETYRGARPLTPEQLAQWRHILETRCAWLAARGIPYLFVIAPDKHSVYPEYMPDAMARSSHESRLDQFLAFMKAHSDVAVLDLRPALREAKGRARLYHRTDTHWNDYGAFVGYQVIIRELGKLDPRLQPMAQSDFEIYSEQTSGLDLAAMLGVDDVTTEDYIRMRSRKFSIESSGYTSNTLPRLVSERKEQNLPRVVMFRDSFSNYLVPFLNQHFSRAVYVWNNGFDPRLVETERPDFVVQEIVERALLVEPQQDPLALMP
jgi:alginate O-acetyltransferase complex protein AlgJ